MVETTFTLMKAPEQVSRLLLKHWLTEGRYILPSGFLSAWPFLWDMVWSWSIRPLNWDVFLKGFNTMTLISCQANCLPWPALFCRQTGPRGTITAHAEANFPACAQKPSPLNEDSDLWVNKHSFTFNVEKLLTPVRDGDMIDVLLSSFLWQSFYSFPCGAVSSLYCFPLIRQLDYP